MRSLEPAGGTAVNANVTASKMGFIVLRGAHSAARIWASVHALWTPARQRPPVRSPDAAGNVNVHAVLGSVKALLRGPCGLWTRHRLRAARSALIAGRVLEVIL